MDRRYWILIFLFAGIVLVLNPLYLHPDGGGHEVTYQVEQIETDEMASDALSDSDRAVQCPGTRLCATEEPIAENGVVEYDGHVDRFDQWTAGWYAVVVIDGQPYLPEDEHQNGTTLLTLTEIDTMEAVEHAAVPAEDSHSATHVRDAIETGSVTLHGEQVDMFERNEIIEHDGEYFMMTSSAGSSHWTEGGTLEFVRAILYLLGIGSLVYYGWEVRKVNE